MAVCSQHYPVPEFMAGSVFHDWKFINGKFIVGVSLNDMTCLS